MKVLVTGSAGHLGEALVRSLRGKGLTVVGIDLQTSSYTDIVGSISDRELVAEAVKGCQSILHTATLHKPHVGTHSRQNFVDTNISGTLNLLEEAVAADCESFVFTSTTSTFGDAMKPKAGAPAVWVTEELRPKPKNIYGVTKTAAEDLCELFQRRTDLSCIVLKTSRFFPERDDAKGQRDSFDDTNLKVNELLYRRADLEDIVNAHLLALQKAPQLGFERFILTSTTPFCPADAQELAFDAPAVLKRYVPQYEELYECRGWKMFQGLSRVYDNTKARQLLGWEPRYTFSNAVKYLSQNRDYRSALALEVGAKGYHKNQYTDGLYPVSGF